MALHTRPDARPLRHGGYHLSRLTRHAILPRPLLSPLTPRYRPRPESRRTPWDSGRLPPFPLLSPLRETRTPSHPFPVPEHVRSTGAVSDLLSEPPRRPSSMPSARPHAMPSSAPPSRPYRPVPVKTDPACLPGAGWTPTGHRTTGPTRPAYMARVRLSRVSRRGSPPRHSPRSQSVHREHFLRLSSQHAHAQIRGATLGNPAVRLQGAPDSQGTTSLSRLGPGEVVERRHLGRSLL